LEQKTLITFDKAFYSKQALLKAAFAFTDRAYLHLSQDANNYLIECTPKNGCPESELDSLIGEIKNELLAQSVRQVVFGQTKNIRELILARSLASTIIDNAEASSAPENTPGIGEAELDEILTSWMEKGDE
jgi:His-Xaa-Ser system protein HxsD